MERLPEERIPLVTDNLHLVHWMLKCLNVPVSSQRYDDYFQEGCIGLILAACRFDATRGFQFSTFACAYIKGQILRHIRDCYYSLKVTRGDFNIRSKAIDLLGKGYDLPSISEELKISPFKLGYLLSTYAPESLQKEVQAEDGSFIALGNLVADWRNEYEDLVSEMGFEYALAKVLDSMKEPGRSMCEEFFYSSMYGDRPTQDYLADKYKMSQPNVGRVLKKFKSRLAFYSGMEL